MVYSAFQFCAFVLTVAAACFLARGALLLDAKSIAEISTTAWAERNETLRASLVQQSADARVGVCLLVLGAALQGLILTVGASLDELGVASLPGATIGTLAALAIIGVGVLARRRYARWLSDQVDEIRHEAVMRAVLPDSD